MERGYLAHGDKSWPSWYPRIWLACGLVHPLAFCQAGRQLISWAASLATRPATFSWQHIAPHTLLLEGERIHHPSFSDPIHGSEPILSCLLYYTMHAIDTLVCNFYNISALLDLCISRTYLTSKRWVLHINIFMHMCHLSAYMQLPYMHAYNVWFLKFLS